MGAFANAGRWMADTFLGPSDAAVPSNPMDPRFWGAVSSSSAAGQYVTAESAAQLDVVQAVLSRLAGTISTLPMMVFERGDDGEKKPAPDHPLYEILHGEPNHYQTAQEYREELISHLAFWRNAYSIIHPGPDGQPVAELEQIHPSRVQKIERKLDGRIYYTILALPPASGTTTYRDDEIWHIRKSPLTRDGLRGQYMWESSRETFGKALAVEQFGALYFKNGGSGGGVLTHPGQFKDREQREQFMEAWASSGGGINRHKDRLLLNDVKYQAFTINNDEAQFIETMTAMSNKLCRLWNMPPHMVGILDKASFSNIEMQSTEYVVYTLAPWISAVEQAARRDLLVGGDKSNFFVEFNVEGLLRGDFKTRMMGYAQGRQWGWLCVDDIRARENMPLLGPGKGDQFLAPMNMTPVGQPGADQTIVTDPGDDDTNPGPQEPDDPSRP